MILIDNDDQILIKSLTKPKKMVVNENINEPKSNIVLKAIVKTETKKT